MEVVNPTVHFSTINSIRNNAITNWYSEPWLSVVNALLAEGHAVSETKDVVLISPWLYKTFDQGAVAKTNDDGEPWLIDDKHVVGRLADNVLGTNMLMLDFDGGMTITLAKSVFAGYAHFGYTSYSHMSQGKNHADCFRIVLPTSDFVTAEDIVARRKSIYAAFPGIDISCLSLARSFYLPSCPPERKAQAHMWDNHGELFNVSDYEADAHIPVFTSPAVTRQVDKQKIIDALKSFYVGNEPTWFNIAVAMVSCDFSVGDFIEVTVGHLMNEKTAADCHKKWKAAQRRVAAGKAMNAGYLINLCKKHGAWTTESYQERRRSMIANAIKENSHGN